MGVYICSVCKYEYDEEKEGIPWDKLPDDWVCPLCKSDKSRFTRAPETAGETGHPDTAAPPLEPAHEPAASACGSEPYLADIQIMAETGQCIVESMRTSKPTFSWDDLLIKGAQLAKIPLNPDQPVSTRTIIGPGARQPLVIETPLYITHMSFGALSEEAVLALAKGSAAVKTAMCSGEGGILPEAKNLAYKYIFEYVPNKYSVTEENLQQVDAVEIKIGQSAKPGLGGHLPASKVTRQIAEIRGLKEGADIISPSHFNDIRNRDDLKKKIDWLRDISNGKPIGIKLAAGHIEADLDIALYANPDFVTIDGRAGATGAAPKFIKEATSVPTLFALYRARKFFDDRGADHVSLIITGGLRISPDFAKALALGADAVAVGTTALIACGCRQYRICNTGQCPTGIATQDPELRRRLNVDKASQSLKNFLRATTEELKNFARLTGNDNVHDLCLDDLCTTNSEISNHTAIEHV